MEHESKAPTPTTRVSVVMPCKNAARWLGEQLDALSRQDYGGPIEVIVADNGSEDASRTIASGHPGVHLVDASARSGPNHARNAGAAHATGTLILTCDADDVVDSHWVAAMTAALAEYDLVAGRIDYRTLNPGSRVRIERRVESGSRLGYLPAAATCNFGIRAPVLHALGGWDETIDYGFEDTDLSWRAQLAGYRLGRAEDAIVHYRLRTTTSEIARQAYRGARGLPLMVRRFRRQGMSMRPVIWKALKFAGYLVAAAPLAVFIPRIRTEWLRKGALAAGVVRGMFSRSRP